MSGHRSVNFSNNFTSDRDYNLGEAPEAVVSLVAAESDVTLLEDFKARQFCPDEDIVQFDLVMVMDKFTAADVLREVSSSG